MKKVKVGCSIYLSLEEIDLLRFWMITGIDIHSENEELESAAILRDVLQKLNHFGAGNLKVLSDAFPTHMEEDVN